jgi:hypothetical protein
MGSRAFYEGWDSNRPNIVLFINIGTQNEAKKFVLQSIGRGVRIEPIKGKRRRLKFLYNIGEDNSIFEKINNYIQPIETLFIFGTNRNALSEVIITLKIEKEVEETIELTKNGKATECTLLIPVFKTSSKKLYQEREPQKFKIPNFIFNTVKKYFISIDDRILIMQNDISPELLFQVKKSFNNGDKYYLLTQDTTKTPLKIFVRQLINHFNLDLEELDKFKLLEEEIIHFKKIKVFLETGNELKELKEKIKKVSEFKDPKNRKEELKRRFERGKITLDEYTQEIEKLSRLSKEETFKDLKIKNILNHYYIPVIFSTKEKVNYIRHIIKTQSEVKFIEDLEKYLENNEGKCDFDWWMFSKIDEHLDEIYIPYYDPDNNKMRKFKPDFVFWFKKGKNYSIVFVDPKGIKHTDFQHKVDWFKRFFGDIESPKIFEFKDYKIKVFLLLYTEDKNRLSEGYKKYWFDNIEKVFFTF